jgi:hypothetical protein
MIKISFLSYWGNFNHFPEQVAKKSFKKSFVRKNCFGEKGHA